MAAGIKNIKAVAGLAKKRKVQAIVAAVLCIALAGYLVLRGSGQAAGDYLVDTVKTGTVTSAIAASGTVEPVNVVQLSFKNAEILKGIHVKVGDHVTTGQLLAELETGNLQASVTQAQASLKSAQAKLESLQRGATAEELAKAQSDVDMSQASFDQAKENLDRYKSLYSAEAVSKSDLDTANLSFVNAEGKLNQAKATLKTLQLGSLPEDIAAAEAQVENSRAQLQTAQSDLAGASMTSPTDGIVSAVNGAVGQRATANNNNTSGGGFITVISEDMQVRAQVNEADIGRTQLGQKVEFTVNSYPDKTFAGKVYSISPQAYTVSNVQIYDIIIQTDEKYNDLKAGMPANVNILVASHENVVTIPKGAVNFATIYMNKMSASGAGARDRTGTGTVAGGGNAGGRKIRNNGGSDEQLNPGEQKAIVLVLDGSKNPVPRQVVLGLSDMQSYEVVKGLTEGEKVVRGSSVVSTSATPSQGNMPFMGGGRR